MVHLQAITSHLPVTPMTIYGTGRWAHINVKLHLLFETPHTTGHRQTHGLVMHPFKRLMGWFCVSWFAPRQYSNYEICTPQGHSGTDATKCIISLASWSINIVACQVHPTLVKWSRVTLFYVNVSRLVHLSVSLPSQLPELLSLGSNVPY